ncbi:MAG: RNA 2',3'-cyclic phosphodiesterase [Phycisphaerales bacterium]|nr:RNA 2',3'-cyclic phosphodiesterase [Phycisphaerales bacterium]MCB9856844.1 RNA 2',3'-cyclic phosphodiesterase [Phycisphaerales bacterium]MCB9862029.1 RNA 2',3'-cyclic phosphodiesterase [Phycisphaerales bacterium]
MRAFIAVDLDAPIRKALGRAQDSLRAFAPKLKYVHPDAMHLTLKFLGEIDPQRLTEITKKLDDVARVSTPFDFEVRDLGCFDDRAGRIRVLWAGIDDVDRQLAAFQQSIETAMNAVGFQMEGRPFTPHLTLARSRRPVVLPLLTEQIQQSGSIHFGLQTVESIVVYDSMLTPEGPIYTAQSRHSLGN